MGNGQDNGVYRGYEIPKTVAHQRFQRSFKVALPGRFCYQGHHQCLCIREAYFYGKYLGQHQNMASRFLSILTLSGLWSGSLDR